MENESQKRKKDIERAAQAYGALELGSSATSANMPASEVAVRSKYAPAFFMDRAATPEGQALNARNEQVLVDDINSATAPEMAKLRRQQAMMNNPTFMQTLINALRGR